MPTKDDEADRLRSVALQNAQSILQARLRAEEELLQAKKALEVRTAELERALDDLKFQNELSRTIAENAASCLLMLDDRGRATYVNPSALKVTGYTIEQFTRSAFHDLLHPSHPTEGGHEPGDCPIRQARERMVPLKDFRDTFVRSDGTSFPTSCSLSPLSRDGRPAGAVLEFRDITDELRVQKALEDASRRKDQFLATLSHELRTPMTSVVGWTHMLKLGLPEDEAREAISAIERSAAIQAQLIDDVLDVSRIMSGKMTFHPRPVDVGSILAAAMTTVHPAAAAKGVKILADVPRVLPPVLGDEGRLQQVLWNLLSNAVKFATRGGTVSVHLAQVDSILRLTVQDTGKGIDPEFLPHVFEAFTQEDSSTTRAHEGLGLGLSIARSLVELHGGRISVASDGAGRGAAFTVELPVTEEHATVVPVDRRSPIGILPPPGGELASLAGKSVLVIDDQEFTRDLLVAIFRRAEADVQTASSVNEGLEQFRAAPPDVVVCDIAMPVQDGYAFVRAVRANGGVQRLTPIVALTAFGRPEDRLHALSSGFDAYMKKPVDPQELVATVLRLSPVQR
ncbi:MAG: ATP-binding protein [Acidobacteriota bacterium]